MVVEKPVSILKLGDAVQVSREDAQEEVTSKMLELPGFEAGWGLD